MLIPVRFALSLIRTRLARAGACAAAIGAAARCAFSNGVVRGVGLAVAVLATVSALVCVTGCPAPTPGNGAISLAWSIRAANGAVVSCDAIGARFVALRIRNRASGAFTVTAFPCANSPGTLQLSPALYDVSFQLDGGDGARLATAPDQTGVSILAGRVRQLDPVTFTVTAGDQSALILHIDAGTTTNCGPASAGGAGITGNTITLEHVGDGCAAVTFARARGAEQRGIYTVSCSSPAVAPCIEKDETLTTNLSPGSYRLHVGGKVSTRDCWQHDDTIDIPVRPAAVIRNLTLQRANVPGC